MNFFSNTGLIIQAIAFLIFVIGIFISIGNHKPTAFSYFIDLKNYVIETVTQKNAKLTPELNINVSYDRKDVLSSEIYNFSISQIFNPNSASVANLAMRIAFKGTVQEIKSQLILTYGRDVSMGVIHSEGITKNGEKVEYWPDTSQLLNDYNISVSNQKINTEKGKLDTNVVTFHCEEWPTDALFYAFVTVNAASSTPQLMDNIADGTYEGTYDYYIDGKKFTEKFNGKIKGEMTPEDAKVWFDKGYALNDLGKNQEALDTYNKALEIDSSRAVIWYNKGFSLSKLGRHEEALEAYNQAIEINPKYTDAWQNKGYTLNVLGRHEEAIEAYDKVIEINPQDLNVWENKGIALANLERYEEALVMFEKAIEINPKERTWDNKGMTLGHLNRYEEAINAFNKAIELNPQFKGAWRNKGVALNKLVRYSEALTAFDKAIEIDPEYAEAWRSKGISLYYLKDYKNSLQAFETAHKLDPSIEIPKMPKE